MSDMLYTACAQRVMDQMTREIEPLSQDTRAVSGEWVDKGPTWLITVALMP